MQLLTASQIAQLKMTATAMVDATYQLIDWATIATGSALNLGIKAHRLLTSDRAIAGYKALYSILMLVILCFQYAAIWLYQEIVKPVDKRPPVVGEIVQPIDKKESSQESVQVPLTEWEEPAISFQLCCLLTDNAPKKVSKTVARKAVSQPRKNASKTRATKKEVLTPVPSV